MKGVLQRKFIVAKLSHGEKARSQFFVSLSRYVFGIVQGAGDKMSKQYQRK